jgi:phosphatidylethanolamine/phosphatidyl-N-methylethanolamine N-methyltransferase
VTIFGIGVVRDHLYNEALSKQPLYPPIHQPYIAYGLIAAGNVLVLSSMWALGVTGTYLGDYFGILMDEKVEGFPFNVTGAPMYWGSTCSFLGVALLRGRLAGLLLTAEVFVMYLLALKFEEYTAPEILISDHLLTLCSPFTSEIYAKKDNTRVTRSMAKSKKKA